MNAYEQSELYRLRHTAAHLLAHAVTELYPGAKLAIGPPIEDGFYYDIDFPEPISDKDLTKIEQRMKELAKLDMPMNKRVAADRDEAMKIIMEECTLGQGDEVALFKKELLDMIPEGDEISFYEQRATDKQGQERVFIDLCRGPHIESTKPVRYVKLMSIAGAYWRGDVTRPQLTRVYGTAFESKDELKAYLQFLEEAKKRDHRRLGKDLGLFIFSEKVGQGLPLWLPKGAALRETLNTFLKEEQRKRGYDPVVTPNIARKALYEKSGHIVAYRDKMFPFMEDAEKETFILKPMNCPFHIEIYASEMRSYRDLPVRYAEFGTVYRYEQSGELAGMLRVRGFTQDDAHLFVTPEQLKDEFKGVVDLTLAVLKKLGLDEYRARIGTRDPESDKYVGHDENWAAAEKAIIESCDELGMEYEVSEGDAAFYGPKLDLVVRDALRREWQMGTIQVDYNLPERFELEYIGEDSKPHRPILIHRAPFGSLERMIGLLTEHYSGAFPLWMSPVQAVILPVADRHNDYADSIAEQLGEQGWRITSDKRRESLGKKIRDNTKQKVPLLLIVGDDDMEKGTVSPRHRDDGEQEAMTLEQFTERWQPA